MTIQAITNLVADWYTPKSQLDDPEPTRFKLKPLDGQQYMNVMVESRDDGAGNPQLTPAGFNSALQQGVVGWENLMDGSRPVPFNKRGLGVVPMEILLELATEIVNRSTPDDDEKKT